MNGDPTMHYHDFVGSPFMVTWPQSAEILGEKKPVDFATGRIKKTIQRH